MPGIISYATEIRMYSWALLFGALTAIYAYRLYKYKTSNKNIVLFGLFSFACAVTHYYGAMTAGLINLALFGYYIINFKGEKQSICKYIICALIQLILYIPFAISLILQFNILQRAGFWLTLKFPDTLYNVIKIQFDSNLTFSRELVVAIVLSLYVYIGTIIYRSKKKGEDIFGGLLSAILYVLVILAGLIISLVKQPILYDRYLLVPTSLLVFTLAFFLSKENKKNIVYFICGFVLSISTIHAVNIAIVNYDSSNYEIYNYINNNINKDDSLFIYDDNMEGFSILVMYPDNMKYFYDKYRWTSSGYADVFGPNLLIKSNLEDIMKNISGRIWMIYYSDNVELEDFIKKYDLNVIEKKDFKRLYRNATFPLILLEK